MNEKTLILIQGIVCGISFCVVISGIMLLLEAIKMKRKNKEPEARIIIEPEIECKLEILHFEVENSQRN